MLSRNAQEFLRADKTALLELLARETSTSLLDKISRADYGADADEHLRALLSIQRTLAVPVPLRWVPREVLELFRWSRPSNPGWKPGLPGNDGHLCRAFSCAVLLVAGSDAESRDYVFGENTTLAPLIESTRHLGVEYEEAFLSFLVWRIANPIEQWEEAPFFVFATLVLALRVYESDEPDLICELARSTIDAEKRLREEEWFIKPSVRDSWLLGTTYYDTNHDLWLKLVSELRDRAVMLREDAQEYILTVAMMLEGTNS